MIDLILLALAGLVLTGVVYIILLTIAAIIDWFNDQYIDENEVPFTVIDDVNAAIKNGNIPVIQGVINSKSGKLVSGRKINAEKIDSQLANYHKKNRIVTYSS